MAQLNDTIVQGDLRVTGDLLGNFHKIVAQSYGYVEFSNAASSYGLLATIDISNLGGNCDIHAIFHVQDIKDAATEFRGDKKLIVDVRTNSDSSTYTYNCACIKYGTNQSDRSIKVYYTDKQDLRIYALTSSTTGLYGSTLCRLESCTGWGGFDLSRRVTMHRGGTVSSTTPSGTNKTVTDYNFVAKTNSAGSTTWPVYIDSGGTPTKITNMFLEPSQTDTWVGVGAISGSNHYVTYIDATTARRGVYTERYTQATDGTKTYLDRDWMIWHDNNQVVYILGDELRKQKSNGSSGGTFDGYIPYSPTVKKIVSGSVDTTSGTISFI